MEKAEMMTTGVGEWTQECEDIERRCVAYLKHPVPPTYQLDRQDTLLLDLTEINSIRPCARAMVSPRP